MMLIPEAHSAQPGPGLGFHIPGYRPLPEPTLRSVDPGNSCVYVPVAGVDVEVFGVQAYLHVMST